MTFPKKSLGSAEYSSDTSALQDTEQIVTNNTVTACVYILADNIRSPLVGVNQACKLPEEDPEKTDWTIVKLCWITIYRGMARVSITVTKRSGPSVGIF